VDVMAKTWVSHYGDWFRVACGEDGVVVGLSVRLEEKPLVGIFGG